MSVIVIGLGNPILGDDGIGWVVADHIRSYLPEIEVDCLGLGGLSLMERLIGYDHAIIIDAIVTGNQPLGTVSYFTLDKLPNFATGHTTSAHDTSLQTAMDVGRAMGSKLPLPKNIWLVTVESKNVYEFSEELAKPVSEAIPTAIETVLAILDTIQ